LAYAIRANFELRITEKLKFDDVQFVARHEENIWENLPKTIAAQVKAVLYSSLLESSPD
jgi:hypothetical protein